MKKKLYTKPVGLLVSDEVYRKMVDLCDEKEISVSAWVRIAIESRLAQETSHSQKDLTRD